MEEKEKEGGAENETRVLSRILSLGEGSCIKCCLGEFGSMPLKINVRSTEIDSER